MFSLPRELCFGGLLYLIVVTLSGRASTPPDWHTCRKTARLHGRRDVFFAMSPREIESWQDRCKNDFILFRSSSIHVSSSENRAREVYEERESTKQMENFYFLKTVCIDYRSKSKSTSPVKKKISTMHLDNTELSKINFLNIEWCNLSIKRGVKSVWYEVKSREEII